MSKWGFLACDGREDRHGKPVLVLPIRMSLRSRLCQDEIFYGRYLFMTGSLQESRRLGCLAIQGYRQSSSCFSEETGPIVQGALEKCFFYEERNAVLRLLRKKAFSLLSAGNVQHCLSRKVGEVKELESFVKPFPRVVYPSAPRREMGQVLDFPQPKD